MAKPQSLFGISSVHIKPLVDSLGNTIDYSSGTVTDIYCERVQDFSFPLKWDHKQMYSSNGQFSVAVGRGKATSTVSFSVGRVEANLLSLAVFDQASTTGMKKVYSAYNGGKPLSSATNNNTLTTITITPPESGVFYKSLSVRDSSGNLLTRSNSDPGSAGSTYSVNETTGVYKVWTSTASTVYIDYAYSLSGSGKTIALLNHQMGSIPEVSLYVVTEFQGQQMVLDFPRCSISSSLDLSLKMDDFSYPKLEFIALANETTGAVVNISLPT